MWQSFIFYQGFTLIINFHLVTPVLTLLETSWSDNAVLHKESAHDGRACGMPKVKRPTLLLTFESSTLQYGIFESNYNLKHMLEVNS